jgi:ribosomal protein S18 acetylase RimI-like enzyme
MPADLPLARRYLGERFERGESVILVAEDAGGELIGFTQLYPAFCSVLADRTYVLYDLFVTPAARGTGAGRALMEAAEAYARAHGAARLQLQTAITNIVGQSLYESCGWKRDELFYVYEKGLRD